MIDNYDEIKNITGYEPGALYECKGKSVNNQDEYKSIEKYVSDNKENGCTYDDKTFNFHMLPKDTKVFEDVSNEIFQKRNKIVSSLKGFVDGNSGVLVLRSGERGNIYNLPVKTNNYYESSGKLFSYIKIHYGGCNYYMMFISFVKTKDRKINSYLKKIQFIKETCDPGYPEESSDFSAVGYGKIYSNPNISFYDDAENIARCFLEFAGYIQS